MEIFNFIRNIFSRQKLEEPRDKWFSDHRNNYDTDDFENLMWQNDDNIDNSRYFKRKDHFDVFTNPLEMTRYFEFQVDNILKHFLFGFNNPGDGGGMDMLPFASSEKKQLRDSMLKQNDEMPSKLDTDLDGKITVDNFSNIWDEHNQPKLKWSQPFIVGKSVKKEYVRRPDGTIEQKQITRDSEGNEEIIITQQLGDKVHTIITKKDKDGVETTTENFCNTNECDLSRRKELLPNENNIFHSVDLNLFPWERFFKPGPKL
ncbi:hypothetical protein ANTQUA_LOCUS2934 [Anthophora quadrimaculata]